MTDEDWLVLIHALANMGLIVVSIDKATGTVVTRVPPVKETR